MTQTVLVIPWFIRLIKCHSYLIVILAISMIAAGMKSIISKVIFVLLLTSIWSIVTAESATDSFLLDANFRKIETSLSRSILDQPCPSGISPLAARFNALQSVLCAEITCLAVINLVFELPIIFCKIFFIAFYILTLYSEMTTWWFWVENNLSNRLIRNLDYPVL